jgi:hypothetical protein
MTITGLILNKKGFKKKINYFWVLPVYTFDKNIEHSLDSITAKASLSF